MRLQNIHQQAVVIMTAVALALATCPAGAAEVTYPVAAYTPEELVKVREWEKTWAGKKIDLSNIDQVADFLLPSILEVYKKPDKWGGPKEGNYFYIVPYKQIIETKGMIESTKKYAPLVKTDAEGTIQNYTDIAGIPFPDFKTGYQLAYNTEFNTKGDSFHYRWWSPSIDPRARTDRSADQEFQELYFIHRTDAEPRPVIPKNKKGYHKGQFLHFHLPAEMHNSRLIVMKFIDDTKEFSSYLYYAEFRRIRRLSQAERTNAIDGTDMIYDDGNMWDGYLSRNTYKLKGKKELFLARNQDMKKVIRQAGQAMPDAWSFERVNTHVLEVTNKDPDYIYGKRNWYIDPETYLIHWQEMWDALGRHWKTMGQPTQQIKTVQGEMKNFPVGFMMWDFQRTHAGFTDMKNKGVGIDISPRTYLLSNLQKSY